MARSRRRGIPDGARSSAARRSSSTRRTRHSPDGGSRWIASRPSVSSVGARRLAPGLPRATSVWVAARSRRTGWPRPARAGATGAGSGRRSTTSGPGARRARPLRRLAQHANAPFLGASSARDRRAPPASTRRAPPREPPSPRQADAPSRGSDSCRFRSTPTLHSRAGRGLARPAGTAHVVFVGRADDPRKNVGTAAGGVARGAGAHTGSRAAARRPSAGVTLPAGVEATGEVARLRRSSGRRPCSCFRRFRRDSASSSPRRSPPACRPL